MSIIFTGSDGNGSFTGYQGTINTQGVNNHFNPDNLGTPDTIQFTSADGLNDLNDSNTQVSLDGINFTGFTVDQWGTMTSTVDGFDYEYVIINVDGQFYMFLHNDGAEVGTAPFAAGSSNPLDDTPYCFVTGSLITTDLGDIPVECLKAGDKVLTRDNGLKVISWIGKRKMCVNSNEKHAPIRIKTDALGKNQPKRDLLVSPQHRVLLTNWRAELIFGESEVLVAAKHLVNDDTIRVATDLEEFEYFHILFDSHQTIFSEGLPTESFHPGDMAMNSLSESSRNEVLELFPELTDGVENYGPAAHPSLKSFEAKALQRA